MAQAKCINCMNDFDISQSTICPHCGYDQSTPKKESYHLDPGYMLNDRYVIGKVIGSGGFGITYVAWDTVLEKKVAVKEYFPTEFVTRLLGDTEVCPYDDEKTYQFEAGLNGFVEEALRLAKLNSLPHIVHIYDSFAANYTAYIIMDFIEGKTLMELLRENGPLPYEDVIKYIVPVLDVLDKVHQEHIIHRDIAPDNIKVNGDDVVLLDFGSARYATTNYSKSMSVLIKPGYSPLEQYSSKGNQGPWTDVYAVAAVMYHLITGKIPKDSCYRVDGDDINTPTEMGFPIPENIENAIMNALNLKPEYRIQSAKEFADALRGDAQLDRVVVKPKDKPLSKKAKIGIVSGIVVAIAVVIAIIAAMGLSTRTVVNSGGTYISSSDALKNYVNEDLQDVQSEIDSIGEAYSIEIDYIYEINSNLNDNESIIVKQSVEPNDETKIKNIDKITFTVTVAPIEMPDFSGKNSSYTEKWLVDHHFKAENISFETEKNNDYPDKTIFSQSVSAGTKIKNFDKEFSFTVAKNFTTTTKKTTTTTTTTSSYTPHEEPDTEYTEDTEPENYEPDYDDDYEDWDWDEGMDTN